MKKRTPNPNSPRLATIRLEVVPYRESRKPATEQVNYSAYFIGDRTQEDNSRQRIADFRPLIDQAVSIPQMAEYELRFNGEEGKYIHESGAKLETACKNGRGVIKISGDPKQVVSANSTLTSLFPKEIITWALKEREEEIYKF